MNTRRLLELARRFLGPHEVHITIEPDLVEFRAGRRRVAVEPVIYISTGSPLRAQRVVAAVRFRRRGVGEESMRGGVIGLGDSGGRVARIRAARDHSWVQPSLVRT